MLHELKILEQYADEVYYDLKTFEIRKNDRHFNIGDKIHFTVYEDSEYVEHPLNYKFYEITYILSDDFEGLQKGFCALAIKLFNKEEIQEDLRKIYPEYQKDWILPWIYSPYPTYNPYEITCKTDSELTVDYNKLYDTSNLGKE